MVENRKNADRDSTDNTRSSSILESDTRSKILGVSVGAVFTVIGTIFWTGSLGKMGGSPDMGPVAAFSMSLAAALFLSAGITCLLVTIFRADAVLTIKSKFLGDTGVRIGSFFAIWAIVGTALYVIMYQIDERRNALSKVEITMESKIGKLNDEISNLEQMNQVLGRQVVENATYKDAHEAYKQFLRWLAEGTVREGDIGIKVAASLSKHVVHRDAAESGEKAYVVEVVQNDRTSRLVKEQGNVNEEQVRSALFDLEADGIVLKLLNKEDENRMLGTFTAFLSDELKLHLTFVVNEESICSEISNDRDAILSVMMGAAESINSGDVESGKKKLNDVIFSSDRMWAIMANHRDEMAELLKEDKL